MERNDYDVIVVGGGMAGLTASAYVSREDLNVLLIEKNGQCGGLVNSFSRDGFLFDAGVRALEDAGIVRPMLKDLGISLDFIKSPVSVGIEDRMLRVEDIESLHGYRTLLADMYPESIEDIDVDARTTVRAKSGGL